MKLQHMYTIKEAKKMPLLRLYIMVFFLILSIYVISTSDITGINKESEVLYIGENKADLKYKLKIEDKKSNNLKDAFGNEISKNVMLSIDDVKDIFDPNLYLIKSKGRIITTTENRVALITINSDEIEINGKKQKVSFKPMISNDKVYIPITTLKEIFNFDLIQGNKRAAIILKDFGKKIVRPSSMVKLKAGTNIFSGSLTQILPGSELIYLSEEEGKVKVLTPGVSIGYIDKNKIKSELVQRASKEEIDKEKKIDNPDYMKDPNYITNYSNFKMNFDKVQKDNTKVNYVVIDLFKISSSMNLNELYARDNNGYELYSEKLKSENLKKLGNITLLKKQVSSFQSKISTYEGRKDLIDRVLIKVKKYNLDGINLDFAEVLDKAALTKFAIELKPRLKNVGSILTIKSSNTNKAQIEKIVGDKYVISQKNNNKLD